MCVAVVGQFRFLFLMVLAFVVQADLSVREHISPLVSFAASNHWQGGVHQPDKRQILVFVLF